MVSFLLFIPTKSAYPRHLMQAELYLSFCVCCISRSMFSRSIHVAANTTTSLLFIAEEHCIVGVHIFNPFVWCWTLGLVPPVGSCGQHHSGHCCANSGRPLSLHFALLCFTVSGFSQIEGLWQPCDEEVCRCHISSSICSLHISVLCFGNSCSISHCFFIVLFALVGCSQEPLMLLL